LFVVLLHRQEIMTRFISPGLFVSWFIVLTLLWIVIGMSLDIYDLTKAADQGKSVWRSAGAAVVTVMVFLCIPILTPVLPTRRVELFSLPLFAALGISAWRAFYAHVLSRVDLQRRALIIGAGWCGRTLAQALAGTGSGGQTAHGGVCYHVLGFIDDDPAKQGQVIAGVPVLGMHHELARLSHELHPDELVFAITHTQLVEESLMDAVLRCREAGMEVTTMSSFYEALTGRVPVEHAGRMLEVVMPVSQSALDRLFAGQAGDRHRVWPDRLSLLAGGHAADLAGEFADGSGPSLFHPVTGRPSGTDFHGHEVSVDENGGRKADWGGLGAGERSADYAVGPCLAQDPARRIAPVLECPPGRDEPGGAAA